MQKEKKDGEKFLVKQREERKRPWIKWRLWIEAASLGGTGVIGIKRRH